MEKVTTAVPYPVVGLPGVDRVWGIICTDHPTWLGTNVPTDRNRDGAEAFAAACACAHPGHKRKRDYSTGSKSGMSFICNRWVFTGPRGYRVKPNGDGTFRVVSYNVSEDWRVVGHGERLSEDDAHELAARMAGTTPHQPKEI